MHAFVDPKHKQDKLPSSCTSSPLLQKKLKVGAPNDRYEQEAETMADRVMRFSQGAYENWPSLSFSAGIQRKCNACEEDEKPIQRKEKSAISSPGPGLAGSLSTHQHGGSPLPPNILNSMNHAFGQDFSSVKVHHDAQAVEMNRQLNAKAFTYGSHIYFNQGEYKPQSAEGKHLLAHELTHVVQQNALDPKASEANVIQRLPSINCNQANEINTLSQTFTTANAMLDSAIQKMQSLKGNLANNELKRDDKIRLLVIKQEFGRTNLEDLNTILDNLSLIRSKLNGVNLKIDCVANLGNRPCIGAEQGGELISVVPGFFQNASNAADSRPRWLIHEVAHIQGMAHTGVIEKQVGASPLFDIRMRNRFRDELKQGIIPAPVLRKLDKLDIKLGPSPNISELGTDGWQVKGGGSTYTLSAIANRLHVQKENPSTVEAISTNADSYAKLAYRLYTSDWTGSLTTDCSDI